MNPIQHATPSSPDRTVRCTPEENGSCAICADEGIVGRVLEMRPSNMALLDLPAGQQEVALDLIENVEIDDHLLVHVGVAIAKLESGD